MIPTSFNRLLNQRASLLLQGPMGSFFATLAKVLRAQGQHVVKVNFNAGDDHYYNDPKAVRFTAAMTEWPGTLRQLLIQHHIDAIVLFGQMRDMHRHAIEVARDQGITIYVFEEGYIRPDYVTLEVGGVNAESSLPRDPAFYRQQPLTPAPKPLPTQQEFSTVVGIAATYGWAAWCGRRRYPHYVHHRSLNPVVETLKWIRGTYLRKWYRRWTERHMLDWLIAPAQHKRFFLVPLQVYNDSQIRCHSHFADVAEFIATVVESFAQHAPADKLLVLKHHPMDRAYNNYTELINDLAREWGVESRLHYIHDQHLPTLLRHACGVVTVNSTTGLQSLYHKTPVIALGECLYDVPDLVFTGTLEQFWHHPGEVDGDLFQRFREHMIRETQLNASFYADTPGLQPYIKPVNRVESAAEAPVAKAQNDAWSASTLPTLK